MKRLSRSIVIFIVWFLQPLLYAQGLAVEPERISLKEFKTLLDNSADVIVVDVRSKDSYDLGHIPGAISIPLSEIQDRHQELPRSQTLILYCS